MMKKIFTLMMLLVAIVTNAWGDDTYEYTNTPSLNTSDYFTVAKGSSSAGTYNVSVSVTLANGTSSTVTKAVKMESGTTIQFSTTKSTATVSVGLFVRNAVSSNSSNNQFKFDGTVYTASSSITAGSYEIVEIPSVAPGSHTIERNSSEVEIYYVKVVESGATLTQLTAPEITYAAATGTVTIGSVSNATKVTYTTDGSAPTASSDTYSAPFVVTDGTVVKAIAIGDGSSYTNSEVASETVYLSGITCAEPTIKSFNGSVAITTTTPNATIKYSIDGGSTYNTYSRSFTLTADATVKAYAMRTSCTDSEVASQAVSVLASNKTKTIYLDYGDFTISTYTATGKSDTDAEGYKLTIGNTSKSWSSNGVNITTPDGVKKEFKLSNGAQNTLSIPDGVHVTKVTLYSVIMSVSNTTANGWKEVGGTSYQTGGNAYANVPMGAYNDVDGYNTNPDVRSYAIDQTGGTITFTNAGNQLSFVLALDILGDNVDITPAYDKSTYVTTSALDFSSVSGLKAYRASAASGGSVTLEEVGAVPSGTPLLLIGTASTTYNVPVAASASDPGTNLLKAGDGTTTFNGSTYDYLLYTDGLFYQIGSGTIAVGKAYLHCASDPTTGAGARTLDLNIGGGGATGIEAIKVGTDENVYYDLQGRRVLYPTKGLYIVNGKKVVIK